MKKLLYQLMHSLYSCLLRRDLDAGEDVSRGGGGGHDGVGAAGQDLLLAAPRLLQLDQHGLAAGLEGGGKARQGLRGGSRKNVEG